MGIKQVAVSSSAKMYLYGIRVMSIVIIVGVVGNYFIKGGVWGVPSFTNWISWSTPLSAMAMIMMSCRSFAIILNRRTARRWWKYVVFFVAFIPLTIIGVVFGPNYPLMFTLNAIFVNYGGGAIIAMAWAFTLTQAYLRVFWASNWLKAWMIIITIIGVIGYTPIASLIAPSAFAQWDAWIITNITSPSSLWLMGGFSIATIVQVTRVLFFKEDLIPEM